MFKKSFYTLLAGSVIFSAGLGHAQTNAAPLPAYEDGAPVILSGTVKEVREDEFDLDYGSGVITVELDDWEWEGDETRFLRPGEVITISGHIDDDFFEGREIEADNVFFQNSYTYYYTDDVYPSYYMTYYNTRNNAIQDGTYVSMRGTVGDITGPEFTLTGANDVTMKVDTSGLGYNPFAGTDSNLQKVERGDQVHVYGEMDDDFFERREIMANSIVVLTQANSATRNQ